MENQKILNLKFKPTNILLLYLANMIIKVLIDQAVLQNDYLIDSKNSSLIKQYN